MLVSSSLYSSCFHWGTFVKLMVRSVQESVPKVRICAEHPETCRGEACGFSWGPEGVQYLCVVSDGSHHTHTNPPADSHRYFSYETVYVDSAVYTPINVHLLKQTLQFYLLVIYCILLEPEVNAHAPRVWVQLTLFPDPGKTVYAFIRHFCRKIVVRRVG